MVSEHPIRWHGSGANDFFPETPLTGWSGAPLISPHFPGEGWHRVAGGRLLLSATRCSRRPPLQGSGLGTGRSTAGRFSEAGQSVALGHSGPQGKAAGPGLGGILRHRQARRQGEAERVSWASWLALRGHGLVEFCSGQERSLTVLPGAVPRGLGSGTPLSVSPNGIYSPQTTLEKWTDSLSEPRGQISASPPSQT